MRGGRRARRSNDRATCFVRQRCTRRRLAYEATHPDDEAGTHPSHAKPGAPVGCSGWFYWHWRDCFYPPGVPTSQWFDHYASQFRTVELNAPFYAWPTLATVQTWRRSPGGGDSPIPSRPASSSPTRSFVGTRTLVRDFYHIANLLGPRLDCFLFQLPPSFHYSAATLKRIVSQLDPVHRNVVEFRHRSWWTPRV